MSTRTDRLADTIQSIASPIILDYVREHTNEFGVVSIAEVTVSKDLSYADIHLSSSDRIKELPKFLSPIAGRIRHEVGQAVTTYKIPQIRFRWPKNIQAEKSVYDLITEISTQYGLREED